MSGWKTWVAAAGAILWGVGGWLAEQHGPDVAIGFITGGLALIGIGHKIEKAAS
jgi:hypothetical protein